MAEISGGVTGADGVVDDVQGGAEPVRGKAFCSRAMSIAVLSVLNSRTMLVASCSAISSSDTLTLRDWPSTAIRRRASAAGLILEM